MIALLLLVGCVAPAPAAAKPGPACARFGYDRPHPDCVDLFRCEADGRTWLQIRDTRTVPAIHFPHGGCEIGDGACLVPARLAAEAAACAGAL